MNAGEEAKIHREIERVARESYGRLVAYLSVHTQDLAGAEDVLSEALLKALTVWPRDGVPENPESCSPANPTSCSLPSTRRR